MKSKLSRFLLAFLLIAVIAPASVFAADLSVSTNNVNISAGQNTTVSLNAGGQIVNVTSVTNSNVAYATISGSIMTIYGLNSGTSTIGICTFDQKCASIFVTVGSSSNNNNNAVSFSQNNISLNSGQSTSVIIFGGHTSYFVSTNTNSNVVTTSISGNVLNLYANNTGTANITVCSNTNQCATLNVSVSSIGSNLTILTTSLANPPIGSFYSAQISASGGNLPYSFSISNGSLPSGLNLSSLGQISGTPNIAGIYNFTVRVYDNFARTAYQTYTMTVTGSVLGSLTYKDGTLVNDNSTIYIIYKNTRSGFASFSAFSGLGYKLSNTVIGSTANLANSGYVITTPNTAHPWGSWIKNGSTIYFVHESGLIPVAYHDVFINNGGEDRLVVNMNAYDFAKPVLPLMALSDSRVGK